MKTGSDNRKEAGFMRRLVCVDRITDGIAVLEAPDRTTFTREVNALPPGTREGDCLWEENGGFLPAPEETARRRERNRLLFQRLKKNPPYTKH